MQCQRTGAEISAYIDHELDARTAAEVESHLRQCASCRGLLDALRETDNELRSLPRLELGPEFAARVALLAGERRPVERRLPQQSPASSGLAQLLEGFGELFGLRQSATPNPLDEFNDFFPLSISSTYFSILGGPERR